MHDAGNTMKIKRKHKIRWWQLLLIILIGLPLLFGASWWAYRNISFAPKTMIPEASDSTALNGNTFTYDIPLDPASPWPKFRANSLQTGRSPVDAAGVEGAKPWVYQTGKGIFSSPVIGGDGTVYIGSADNVFYALNPDGSLKWHFVTGNIIDSSALLDDKGRVYFGSGDGTVYALDQQTGSEIWKFSADTAGTGADSFISWFEGNIAMGADGTLYAPNDNFMTYAIDRDTGKEKWHFVTRDQTWSLPAVNARTGSLFMGNCFFTLENAYCISSSGQERWSRGTLGSMVASPMLTTKAQNGAVIMGGFDGILRAYRQDNGKSIWTFGTRDHIYSSPSQLSDGTIIQAAADGTVYALDPQNGKLLWCYDTLEPIRSSPAVDGGDRIYFGSGSGRLYCLNADGTLRWSYQCGSAARNDLNASPALGKDGVVIAGESGGIYFVPYDYPLSAQGAKDPRSAAPEALAQQTATFVYNAPFGDALPPTQGQAQTLSPGSLQPVTLSLLVRDAGATRQALIDANSLSVKAADGTPLTVYPSADRRFVVVIPDTPWHDTTLTVSDQYRVNSARFGLKFFGEMSRAGGEASATFTIHVPDPQPGLPLSAGQNGGAYSLFDLGRLSAPLPSILPSYNQIGFGTIHYLLSVVEGADSKYVLWGTGAKLDPATGQAVVDPHSSVRFALELEQSGDSMLLYTRQGFTLSFNGWDMPYALFRVQATMPEDAQSVPAAISAVVRCDEIKFYGPFLKLLGVSDMGTGNMIVSAAADLVQYPKQPGMDVAASFVRTENSVTARVEGNSLEGKALGILLIDPDTGSPVGLNYAKATIITRDAQGVTVTVTGTMPGRVRAYLMVGTAPAASEVLVNK